MKQQTSKKGSTRKVIPKKGIQQKQSLENSSYFNLIGLIIIIITGITIYSNSFDCSFHLDDRSIIKSNPKIQNIDAIQDIYKFNKTRFIPDYTFALNYHFGKLDVWGYHFVNLLIHLINASLVYWLTLLIFASPNMKTNSISKYKNSIAFFTAMLFVSHPLATESITYIVQRIASLAALFYLLSVILYIKGRYVNTNSRYMFFAGSFISAVFAFFTKENAFTLPFAILLVEVFFIRTKRFNINFKDYRVYIVTAALLGFIALVVTHFSFKILKPITPEIFTDYKTITSFNYAMTQFSVIIKYIQLLLLPLNQNLDYEIKLSNDFFDLSTLICSQLLLVIIALAIYFFKKYRILSFGIIWFLLTLSIESSIIPIADLIFEHRTYLPSFGFFLMMTSGIYLLLWERNKNIALGIFALIILSNSYLTFQRNKVWKDDYTLWSDVIAKSPDKIRAYNNRGLFLMNEKRYDESVKDYTKAIELYPASFEPNYNLGILALNQKNAAKGIEYFDKAIKIQPKYSNSYYFRAVLLENAGNIDKALNDLDTAIKLAPKNEKAYRNRGSILAKRQQYDDALSDYSMAIKLKPDDANAYNDVGNLYSIEKKYEDAITNYSKAIEIKSDYPEAYFNRGLTKFLSGNNESGCTDMHKAADLGHTQAIDFCKHNCK
jgi:tetratricopeptide (TPR) repeat protein